MAQLGLTCQQALQIFSQHETLRLQRENDALKQRLSRYELPEELRLEHSAGEHDAFDDRYRGMARRLDQHLKNHLPRYIDRNTHERYIDHMDIDIFASTELVLQLATRCSLHITGQRPISATDVVADVVVQMKGEGISNTVSTDLIWPTSPIISRRRWVAG